MQISLMNWLSTWGFLLYLTILTSAISTLIFILVKRFYPVSIHTENKELFTLASSIVIANYGFLLGFVIITLWQTLEQATTLTAQEANELAVMVYDTFAFPSEIQKNLSNTIGQYIKFILQDEWETMRWGNASSLAENSIKSIFDIIQSYSPQGETEISYYRDMIYHFNNALENRRLRLEYLSSMLINPLRFILLLGLLLISFFVSLIEVKKKFLHWSILMLINFVVAFNVSLALLLDFPFSGQVSVSSAPFEQGILSQFNQQK